MSKNKVIALVGAVVLGALGLLLKAPVADLVCGKEVPEAAPAPAPASQ